MQQLIRGRQVVLIGGGRGKAVNQANRAIDTNMALHAKVPLIALLRLMPLRITRLISILRRAGRFDDRRINDTAFPNHQAMPGQLAVDLLEQLLAQIVLFQQVPEVQDRRLIGNPGQANTRKTTHRLDLIQRVLHRRITQVVDHLHHMNPQQARQRVWGADRRGQRSIPAPSMATTDPASPGTLPVGSCASSRRIRLRQRSAGSWHTCLHTG